ncbi:MAG TPA: ATP-grasp domain-containing protein, partial [Anaeromyxobacteraceae bacterium]|nr:ATP-grasp domain-containing protein [Anaeromyxobacteraceae bacterium]
IGTYLPTQEQFEMRSKARLAELGQRAGLDVPETAVVSSVDELVRLHERIPYPVMIKGIFYGAHLATSLEQAIAAFHLAVARWGLPVIVQKHHVGEEYDVVAVGDGEGRTLGAVPMKKMFLTDQGKGWAGVTVKAPALFEVTRKFMEHTRWRGPCEIEILRTAAGRHLLLEVNPRFPAWVYLSVGAGQNLPWLVARLAMGERAQLLPDAKPGVMFVRISLDQIAQMDDFQQIAATGERTTPAVVRTTAVA